MMFRKLTLPLLAVCVLASFVAAQADDDEPSGNNASAAFAAPSAPPGQPSTQGRLLASNCFQCHGTNGSGGFERITGGEAGEIREFRSKTASKDIMAAHAQGYTDAQIEALVSYLNQLR